MNSDHLKVEAMAWLRYGKRCPIVCTEVGGWNADVLGIDTKASYEVEVKVSKSDIKAEFRNKQAKHHLYKSGTGTWCPNYFYMMVPADLQEAAIEACKEHFPAAGVIAMADTKLLAGHNSSVVQKPQRLHSNKPTKRLMAAAMMRMSSELCGVKRAVLTLSETLTYELKRAISDTRKASWRVSAVLDMDNADAAMNLKAAELLAVMEPQVAFESLPPEAQELWRTRAEKLQALQNETEAWENASYLL